MDEQKQAQIQQQQLTNMANLAGPASQAIKNAGRRAARRLPAHAAREPAGVEQVACNNRKQDLEENCSATPVD